ncbi:hypothetical protein C8J56DRAFT_846731 [Mycena floridula]|nr:hypothetical protein C8J56DRAFT_846731 [Mycena floridula]
MSAPNAISYAIVNVFSTSPFGGNPAAVVLQDVPEEIMAKLARNFQQPMTAFVSPSHSNDPKLAKYKIRWFTLGMVEVPLCGHATLAAARILFDGLESEATAIEFTAPSGTTITARKLDDGLLEIELLASSGLNKIVGQERERLLKVVEAAFGRPVIVHNIVTGVGGALERYILFELDPSENLGECIVTDALKDTGFLMNIFISDSPGAAEDFVVRTFSPVAIPGNGEDSVCGSANCISGPYWHKKKALSPSADIAVTAVSPRGGNISIRWEEETGKVKLRARQAVFAQGQVFLNL